MTAEPTPCMTADEFESWQAANALLRDGTRAKAPCSDCPGWFARENQRTGTCDGHPYGQGPVVSEPRPVPSAWHVTRALPTEEKAERRRAQYRAYAIRVGRVRAAAEARESAARRATA